MCVLKKHMQTTVFLVCLEAQDRFSGSSRKKGEMRDSFLYGERMGGVSQNGVNLPGVLLAESRNRYSGVQRHLVGC